MNMLQAIAEAEKHPKDEFTATMRFVMSRRRAPKFITVLSRIMTSKVSVDWNIVEQPALLNTSYVIKVTGTGWQISKIVQYFAACGFAF